jgi:hypothetical protein
MLDEPPGADPHAGWCGDWGLETPGYPIMRLCALRLVWKPLWVLDNFLREIDI